MAINKLMEAAADILAQSKRNAGSMPMQKMAGSEVEDLGGMDNKTATNPGDSIKVKATDEKGNHAKNVADYKMHPSAASVYRSALWSSATPASLHKPKAG